MPNLVDIYRVDNFNDTFALGHYARVLDALDRRVGHLVALKVMRAEHLSADGDIRWEYRAFANEADLLTKLADNPYVVDLLDCGYLSNTQEFPTDGELKTFQRDVLGFVQAMPDYAGRGWRPYLALQNLPRTNNLLYLMKPNQAGSRWRLPSEEGLALALQFAEILRAAHIKHIVYLDHKLEHVYWDGTQLHIIDFNSSRQLDPHNGSDRQFYRMDIHNLCVGILYPIFTGLSPLKTTLRPQPGNITDAEARYRDITQLDFGIEPTLSGALKELLQAGAAMEIDHIEDFISALQQVASLHGWDFPQHYTSPASRDARSQMRAGLTRLRRGQADLREARDLFREAAIQDGITEDLEAELRRLVKAVNDMLNNRVIP
ncbi:MAG: serine/threonine protein kinase [Chloroflexi bacterium]|nr:serine/threonine protein kinase [Chloroflexota bacterium]